MSRYEDLENLIDFSGYDGPHDETFEQVYLMPRLEKMGWVRARFCCGERGQVSDSYFDRTVQVVDAAGNRKTFKYGRI